MIDFEILDKHSKCELTVLSPFKDTRILFCIDHAEEITTRKSSAKSSSCCSTCDLVFRE